MQLTFTKQNLIRLLLVCILTFLSSDRLLAEADTERSTVIIDLEHRSSEEVIAGLEPHLDTSVRISSLDQRLILTGPTSALEVIAELVVALDQPKQEYLVLFAQGRVNPEERQAATTRSYSTAQSDLVSLRLTSGVAARLERGFWVPISTAYAWGQQTEYQWMAGGVWVQAERRGKDVVLAFFSRQLEKNSRKSRLESAQAPLFSGAEVQSQLRLEPGSWQLLASEGQLQSPTNEQGRRFSTQKSDYYYSICVEKILGNQQCPRF